MGSPETLSLADKNVPPPQLLPSWSFGNERYSPSPLATVRDWELGWSLWTKFIFVVICENMQAHSSSSSLSTRYLSCHGVRRHKDKDTLLRILRFPSPSLGDSLAMTSIGNLTRRRRRSATTSFTNHTNAIPPRPFSYNKSLSKSSTVAAAASSSSPSPSTPQSDDEQEGQSKGLSPRRLWRRFWKVAAPYWWSEDRTQARLQLAAVFALTLGTTGVSVGFNFLGRDFYNALANKDAEQFTKQLLYYLGGFACGIPFFVLRDYAREILGLRWRSWMTRYYMERYLKDRTFYKIQSQSIIDNPDQRIVDDLSSFTGTALSFSLIFFNAAVDLISFSNILYGIYPPLFVVLLVYSIGGTAISVLLGKGLVTLNFLQEKKEADFRYGLVRVRENAESIAFYGGEENELQLLLQRFSSAFENLTQLLISSRNLEFFTNGYRYLIQILPAAVVAPMYFSGKIEFGVINQSVSAFNHILGDFSLIVYQFQAISAFSAVIDRLGEFDDILDGSTSKYADDSTQHIHLICHHVHPGFECNGPVTMDMFQKLLHIENLTLQTPTSKTTLIKELSLQINCNDSLLVMGPSGSGKTSFLRAIAGLWNSGSGTITFYVQDAEFTQSPISKGMASLEVNTAVSNLRELEKTPSEIPRSVFFLPQRPYMNLGTLREQLLYPTWLEGATPNSNGSSSTVFCQVCHHSCYGD
ncbi:ABC transporter D family member 2, chloroplastic isoform X2 [Rhodamnia argentea]|uniref:ABC transporter D family member 2, chloroplastic isoform X2 n=1 Tax=Rhodamnia argentea TaxID=178133 RepID=A0A8B8PIF5_9MYRT|nr:ABC transporter D family member 2, chloroplastic isoform X2 [Rhodamnia argentea]